MVSTLAAVTGLAAAAAYLAGTVFVGVFLGRYIKDSSDMFAAGGADNNPVYGDSYCIQGGNGYYIDTGTNIQYWDPGRVYRWRMEWGSGPLGNTVQVFLDDVPILLQQYTRDYTPKVHWIELGVEERRESIVGTVYANVRIGRRQ